eukprot:CAMPEP_0185902422 /NCGR_PEP_ID=MMETSP0196C-20130402/1670_1 /TAXON_ID=2932 /ORGANISM="Alexandrium fundyense, Strain CCMP1719" /LENGTH=91 /DNA_ID=CAMNT_0028621269 /DNA_START=1 /DNA_END=276 /DNA_ORIENTATION=+
MFLFLNQMLGIVQLNLYTNQRLFRFIFGGVDNFVDKSEQRRMRVWNASFQKAAWEAFKNIGMSILGLSGVANITIMVIRNFTRNASAPKKK